MQPSGVFCVCPNVWWVIVSVLYVLRKKVYLHYQSMVSIHVHNIYLLIMLFGSCHTLGRSRFWESFMLLHRTTRLWQHWEEVTNVLCWEHPALKWSLLPSLQLPSEGLSEPLSQTALGKKQGKPVPASFSAVCLRSRLGAPVGFPK